MPAEFSISSHVSPSHWSSASFIAGTTRSSPASKPAPRCEPTWNTTDAPIADAAPTVLQSVVADFS